MSIPTPWSMARWFRHVHGRITRAGCGSLFVSCRRRLRSRAKRLPASAKATGIPVYIESSRTRTFACAYDWPGWCRSGKDEASALAALAAYAPRYAAVAQQARVTFDAISAEAIQRPSNGAALVEKGWPQRYAARRIAWHALDHAWEMQDRSDPSKG